jgi:hypothetical protein
MHLRYCPSRYLLKSLAWHCMKTLSEQLTELTGGKIPAPVVKLKKVVRRLFHKAA